MGRSVGGCSQRASGEFNRDSAGSAGVDQLLSFFEPNRNPGPADHTPNHTLVSRNSSTRTAPKIMAHTHKPRRRVKHRHELTPADKLRNERLISNLSPSVIQSVMQRLVDYLQFCKIEVPNLLEMYDTDDSGSLSITELECALAKMGIKMTHKEVHALICFLDHDGDMELDIHELEHALHEFQGKGIKTKGGGRIKATHTYEPGE